MSERSGKGHVSPSISKSFYYYKPRKNPTRAEEEPLQKPPSAYGLLAIRAPQIERARFLVTAATTAPTPTTEVSDDGPPNHINVQASFPPTGTELSGLENVSKAGALVPSLA